ncbi:hypothetical protein [Streptomyces sp. NPDC090080]|uniref:hypothetical protein n=1 Tax=Streptomyces sp. NPDC090080 TaxID=3365939 RepID=UPI00380BEE02
MAGLLLSEYPGVPVDDGFEVVDVRTVESLEVGRTVDERDLFAFGDAMKGLQKNTTSTRTSRSSR